MTRLLKQTSLLLSAVFLIISACKSPATANPSSPTSLVPTIELAPTPLGGGTGYIAFGLNSADSRIFIVNANDLSSTARALTNFSAYSPSWSPDGKRVAFTAGTSSTNAFNLDIYILDVNDSTKAIQITSDPALDEFPAWSPIGNLIAFSSMRAGNSDIYLVDTKGTAVQLTTDPATDRLSSWSPDGKRIAFQSDRAGNLDIYIMDADGSNVVQITTDPGSDITPSWSPDGQKIAFASDRTGNFDIYIMSADGSNVVQLTKDSPADEESPAWSPDGQYIAFDSGAGFGSPPYGGRLNLQIFIAEVDGTDIFALTGYDSNSVNPAWQP